MADIEQKLDWWNVYLLGWHDHNGRSYLTSWDGDAEVVHVVITGASEIEMSQAMWHGPIPPRSIIHEIPSGIDPDEHAKQIGGYHAFGWYMPNGFKRMSNFHIKEIITK
jgi:hypothetical protein